MFCTSHTIRFAIAALLALASPTLAYAQVPEHEGEIEGVVRDAETELPLAGALVALVDGRNSTITHGDGSFHLVGIPPGTHSIVVERLGYASTTVEVEVGPGTGFTVVSMDPTPLEIGGIMVTGSLSQRSADEALRPVTVMAGQDLQERLQGTVAQTLLSEPGISATSMGPATSRPVIRGMSGDRVLMLEDGARVGDVSSSGSDHATALNPSSARRIEVVRGPSALLYGSNALGGVINVIRDEVPAAVPHHVTGSATAQAQTVSGAWSGSSSVTMPLTERIPLRLEVSGRTSGDLGTPVGRLMNTHADTWTLGGGSALVTDWGHLGAAFRAYDNQYGIPGSFVGGHAQGVRIDMQRTSAKARAVVDRPVGPFESIEVDGLYTWYRHTEIEPPDIVGTIFQLYTASADVLARHAAMGPFTTGAVGIRTSFEDFQFGGSLSTPNSKRYTAAAFVFEEIDLDPVRLELGLRYDWVRADPSVDDPNANIGPVGDRTFGNFSGSVGLLYDFGGGFSLGTSVARAFRTPDITELYSEGPHLAAYTFEVGNPTLGSEVGTGIDVFARFGSDRVRAELTGFYNGIDGYVYGEETGQLSPVLLPVYQFRGNDASLRGFEGGLHLLLRDALELEGTVSYVRAALERTDAPLPLIPPLNGRLGLKYDLPTWFVRAEAQFAARQDRIGQFETPTAGYTAFSASAGLRIPVRGRLNTLTASIENITDATYRNHLSRVKEIMPEAGRGISLTYRVVF